MFNELVEHFRGFSQTVEEFRWFEMIIAITAGPLAAYIAWLTVFSKLFGGTKK